MWLCKCRYSRMQSDVNCELLWAAFNEFANKYLTLSTVSLNNSADCSALPASAISQYESLAVRRGSRAANRLKSGAGNFRYAPLAKIRF
jgi:hypothetical protein